MKKEKELLSELHPLFAKYDWNTIKNCLNYILKNESIIQSYQKFLHGPEKETVRSSASIGNLLEKEEREKKTVLTRLSKYMTTAACSMESIKKAFTSVFGAEAIPDSISTEEKKTLVTDVIAILKNSEMEQIRIFEKQLQIAKENRCENNLENWSKLIITDDPAPESPDVKD